MKKIFAFILLGLPLAVFAEQDFGVNIPEWKDFAPKAYADVQAPRGLSKWNPNVVYWFERRAEFQDTLDACRSLEASDERFSCYEKLKVEQYKLNNDYNARLEAQIKGTTSIPGMESRTDNMIPINGDIINNTMRWMPSEFR